MLSNLPAQVRETIRKHRMVVANDRVLAGVSGGADSVCLAFVLKELGYDVAIAHLNHGLRGQASDDDETFVVTLAQRLDLKCFSRKVALAAGNIEAAGRDARKDFFNELAAQHNFTKIAVAHTRSDRVETFLLNLLRGAGSTGLASMAPVAGRTIRPLIAGTRKDIEDYLTEKQATWRVDASNFNLEFARSRLRHVTIPKLSSEFNPNLLKTLSRTAEILEAEDAWMRAISEDWLLQNGTKEGDSIVVQVKPLQAAPLGLVRRVVRGALLQAGFELRDVSFDHVDSVRTLLDDGKSGKFVELPGGIQVAREFDRLVFRKCLRPTAGYEYELRIPGSVHIPEVGKVFRAEIIDSETRETQAGRVFVDADSIGPCVRIRNWKPGDYYKPVGLPAGKLKKLFQRARVSRSDRANWPVVVADSTIIWVASFPVSRDFVPRGCSQKIVAIETVQI